MVTLLFFLEAIDDAGFPFLIATLISLIVVGVVLFVIGKWLRELSPQDKGLPKS